MPKQIYSVKGVITSHDLPLFFCNNINIIVEQISHEKRCRQIGSMNNCFEGKTMRHECEKHLAKDITRAEEESNTLSHCGEKGGRKRYSDSLWRKVTSCR